MGNANGLSDLLRESYEKEAKMLKSINWSSLLIVLLCTVVTGCGDASKPIDDPISTPAGQQNGDVTNADDEKEPPTLVKHEWAGVKVHKFGDIYLAAQPGEEDFAKAKDEGVSDVIDIRHGSEHQDFDEKAIVEGAAMEYHHIPWNGPNELTDEVFDEIRALLRDREGPTLLHCGSCNRVGPLWMAYRVLDDGATYEQALAEAKTAGMRTEAYEEKAKDYIERKKTE